MNEEGNSVQSVKKLVENFQLELKIIIWIENLFQVSWKLGTWFIFAMRLGRYVYFTWYHQYAFISKSLLEASTCDVITVLEPCSF